MMELTAIPATAPVESLESPDKVGTELIFEFVVVLIAGVPVKLPIELDVGSALCIWLAVAILVAAPAVQ